MIAWQGMLAAIGFDDQPCIKADKVDDVGRYRKLSSEPEAKLFLPQHSPKRALRIG